MRCNLFELKDVECFLLDMDGTIYLSNNLIDGAIEFLDYLEKKKIRRIFLTNNSSKNAEDYQKKLSNLGIKTCKDDVFTSGEATRILLNKRLENKRKRIFLLGNESLEQEFIDDNYDLLKEDEDPEFVVLGFDTTLTYQKIKVACDYINAGVPFVATHPDLRCPIKDGYIPDVGSMIKMFEAFTEKSPEIIGKPSLGVVDAVVSKYKLNRNKLAMVGGQDLHGC